MHTRTIESLDTAVFLLLLVFADAKHKAIYFDIGLGSNHSQISFHFFAYSLVVGISPSSMCHEVILTHTYNTYIS